MYGDHPRNGVADREDFPAGDSWMSTRGISHHVVLDSFTRMHVSAFRNGAVASQSRSPSVSNAIHSQCTRFSVLGTDNPGTSLR